MAEVAVATALVPVAPAVDEVGAVLAAGSRSFHFASLFLPADRRQDAALLYALCRHVDDLADEAPDAAQATAALARLEAELTGARRPRPLVAAIHELARRRDLELVHAVHLIEGVRGDLDEVRVADDVELVRYGYRVAGTVGLMMCAVLGVRDPRARAFAVDLGVAMQLTNICRDVAEDARLGRVYLPATRLRALGVDPAPAAVLEAREAVRRVVHDLLGMADRYYRSAEDGMHHIPWRARLAIVVAARVYRRIGVRLARNGCDPLVGRTVVPWWEKGLAALGALLAWPRIARRRAAHRPHLHRALRGLPGADPRAPAE
ncbi:MAG: phytoene/squalene synthase family protein [Alphaproteobacteria bacterium]|nr:phytoene/squalene synthase family protein [Alphaproteobacteria bacterium]